MVPIETDMATTLADTTALLTRYRQNPLSTQTSWWNANVGGKKSSGGTANASTGRLKLVSTAQTTGIRVISVKVHRAKNSGICVRARLAIKTRLVPDDTKWR